PRVFGIAEPAHVPPELRARSRLLPPAPAAGTRTRVLRRARVAVPGEAASGAEAPRGRTPDRRGGLGGLSAPPVLADAQAGPRRRPVPGAAGVRPPVRRPVRRVRRGRGHLHGRANARALRVARGGGPARLRVRRRGDRLAAVPPGRPLSGGDHGA